MFYDMMLIVDEQVIIINIIIIIIIIIIIVYFVFFDQGEMIDNIENQVENAAVYVYKGTENVKKAVVYSRSNRRVSL